MADKTYTLDSGTTKGKFVDIGNSLFAKADVPLVKTASGLYLPFPITDAGYYPAVLQAGSDVVGKVGIDQTTPGTTNKVVAELSGSKMKLYGATISDRPDATTVPIGATFTIVDASQEFNSWMSDGTSWGEEI